MKSEDRLDHIMLIAAVALIAGVTTWTGPRSDKLPVLPMPSVPSVRPIWILPIPPAEYDKPYDGLLREFRGDAAHMERVCAKKALGCARRRENDCSIWIANDDLLEAAGWSYDLARRHEIAHCVGWPGDHPGARYLLREHGAPVRYLTKQDFGARAAQ